MTEPSDPKAAIFEVRDRFVAALLSCDSDALDQILGESFTFVDARGKILIWRDALVDLARRGELRFEEIDLIAESLTVNGDEATIQQDLKLAGSLRGQKYDGEYRVTDMYRRTDSGWKVTLSGARART